MSVPARPWVFAGWVSAQGGWLDYQAAQRGDAPRARSEVTATLTRLHRLAAGLDGLLTAMAAGGSGR